jgi:biopolymer transport protein ExbD
MRLSKHQKANDVRFNMTAMIDIVFLLIIFYITVSQITPQNHRPIELAKINSGGDPVEPVELTINIEQDGRYHTNGRFRSLTDVVAIVSDRWNAVQQQPGALKILIRADYRVKSRYVNDLSNQLRDLGIVQIRTSARRE